MDNLTHTLIGVTVARILPKRFRKPEIYWTSVIANNLPDADLIVRFLPGSSSLEYLVHHRGYTHTFLFAPLMGFLAAWIAKKITRSEHWSAPSIAVGVLGSFLHIGADALNNYGVHPFSPFSNEWFYGDTIFIAEPLLWFLLLPYIAFQAERKWSRRTWWLLTVPLLFLVWWFPGLSQTLSLIITLFFGLCVLVHFSIRNPFHQAIAVLLLFLSILGTFFEAGVAARRETHISWSRETNGAETEVDISSTPMPGNPLCWTIWHASKNTETFFFRSSQVSLLPSIYPVEKCSVMSPKTRTADFAPSNFSPSPKINWIDESRLKISDWSLYKERSPVFRRFLGFARFPFLKHEADGRMIAGDLRYDREVGLGFSEVELPREEKPSNQTSPWNPPLR